MTKNKNLCLFFLIFLFLSSSCFGADNWVIASKAFEVNKTGNKIAESLCQELPSSIMENLGSSLNRDVTPDEKFLRSKYDLENSRISLFLQLSSEYKKRDNLVLGDYSKNQLKKKLKEEDEKIKEIEDKIEENLKSQKEAGEEAEKNQKLVDEGKYVSENISTESEKWLYLVKNLFIKNDSLISQEQITFYKNDCSQLFKPAEEAEAQGYESYAFQKEVLNAKINTLLTGKISNYGDYLSVQVEAYLFPGGKKIASVMEIGSIREVEFISSNIANKLVPFITNALPVQMEIAVFPSDVQNVRFYLDDVLQNLDRTDIFIDSGKHSLQFDADGYKSVSAIYNFEGNRKYKIEINLVQDVQSFLYLKQKNPSDFSIFASGENAQLLDNQYSRIKINGQNILGQFTDAQGLTGTFYIPQNIASENNLVQISPKIRDNSKYIDKRRKIMYGSYSALMISLIPAFYCSGKFNNSYGVYNQTNSTSDYNSAKIWSYASDISKGISIGCGVFFGYELVRYLIAADSVLPQKAKDVKIEFDESMLNPEFSMEEHNQNVQTQKEE